MSGHGDRVHERPASGLARRFRDGWRVYREQARLSPRWWAILVAGPVLGLYLGVGMNLFPNDIGDLLSAAALVGLILIAELAFVASRVIFCSPWRKEQGHSGTSI